MEAVINRNSSAIHVTVAGGRNKLTGVIAQSGGSFPKYEGEYEVIPSLAEDIKLETAKKLMTDDVTVRKLPRYDVANEAGGTTVYLGGM
jgi:hypothetical protein